MDNQNLIKIINPIVAEKLKTMGFNYIKEKMNNKDVFVFVKNEELDRVLMKSYSNTDFFLTNKLCF